MDRDEFIIRVYCMVCEHQRVVQATYGIRYAGFPSALTNPEIITMEIRGEYFKCAKDKDI